MGMLEKILYQGRGTKGLPLKSLINPRGEIWGTTEKETAELFARPNETYYPNRKPPEVTKELMGEVYPMRLDIKNPYPVDIKETVWNQAKEAEAISRAKQLGHDGLVINHPNGKQDYVAFDVSQIRPAMAAGMMAGGAAFISPDRANAEALQEPAFDPTTLLAGPARWGGGLMNMGVDAAMKYFTR